MSNGEGRLRRDGHRNGDDFGVGAVSESLHSRSASAAATSDPTGETSPKMSPRTLGDGGGVEKFDLQNVFRFESDGSDEGFGVVDDYDDRAYERYGGGDSTTTRAKNLAATDLFANVGEVVRHPGRIQHLRAGHQGQQSGQRPSSVYVSNEFGAGESQPVLFGRPNQHLAAAERKLFGAFASWSEFNNDQQRRGQEGQKGRNG